MLKNSNAPIFIYRLFLSVALSLSTYTILDELIRISPDFTLVLPLSLFVVFFFFATSWLKEKGVETFPAHKKHLHEELDLLHTRRSTSLFAIVAIGCLTAFLTAQTISTTSSEANSLRFDTPALETYTDLLQLQRQKIRELGDQRTTQDREAKSSEISLLSTRIEELRISADNERKTLQDRTGTKIDGGFLFQFFSNLLVRLGTIAILLYFFGSAMRQFRKYEKRSNEVRSLIQAVDLIDAKIKIDDLRDMKICVQINDEQESSDTNKIDTVFSENFTDLFTKNFTAIADKIGIHSATKVQQDAEKGGQSS